MTFPGRVPPGARIVCVGETMAVVAPVPVAPLRTASTFSVSAGGAESNVALHLAHRGFDVAWVGRLGADPLGARVLDELIRSGVDTRSVIVDGERSTGVYFKDSAGSGGSTVLYYRRGSAATGMSPADFDRWAFSSAGLVHTSGITVAISPSSRELVERIVEGPERQGYLLSFDVNHRSALWSGRDAGAALQHIARRCDIVFVGLDEAQTIWDVRSAEDVADHLPDVLHVVVKDGDREAVEFTRHADGGRSTHRAAAERVNVIEAVGAGDAFAAGFLDGLLRGRTPEERLRLGHALAARTLRSPSDYELHDAVPAIARDGGTP